MTVRAYLCGSIADQNASRAKDDLTAWLTEKGAHIDTDHIENVSGATADRDELRRLLAEAKRGEVERDRRGRDGGCSNRSRA